MSTSSSCINEFYLTNGRERERTLAKFQICYWFWIEWRRIVMLSIYFETKYKAAKVLPCVCVFFFSTLYSLYNFFLFSLSWCLCTCLLNSLSLPGFGSLVKIISLGRGGVTHEVIGYWQNKGTSISIKALAHDITSCSPWYWGFHCYCHY